MQIKTHALSTSALGTNRELVSFHYGTPGVGQKIYVQASLHADELPGMLVAHHLRSKIEALESAGMLNSEIVIVPMANPIGMAQMMMRTHLGRFDVGTGENFNRHYPALFDGVVARVANLLGDDARANVSHIREAMRAILVDESVTRAVTEVSSLRRVLLALACDADVVLDLHCDCDAVLHLYTGTPLWPQAEPLARYLGASATLLATESGDNPFDEACSQTWWQLAEHFPQHPIPLSCLSVTVELRGMADVDHAMAISDADAIISFLKHRGAIKGETPPLGALKYPATPLAGAESITTPVSGVVAFLRKPGDCVKVGDAVAEVINPLTAQVHTLNSTTDGIIYAQENHHFATAGMWLVKVAGAVPFRSGKLLSA
jgi:uncharacterized protein